ncbi:MAG: CRISPR-associated helicase Cas3' [Synergistaceae bacterium]|jgi:CRISPR-associated endonuclease/helicase Cas3|nr:CRISPR-associated helicase Cas3' [Synergistaceae bacterium]
MPQIKPDMNIAHIRNSDGAPQTLETHLTGVAALAKENAKKFNLEKLGELLGLLHDGGKYSSQFQSYIRSAEGFIDQDSDEYVDAAQQKGKIDHSTAGTQWLWQARSLIGGALDMTCAQMLSLVLASHHSGLIDCLTPDGMDNFSRRIEKSDNKTHLDEVRSKFPEELRKRLQELLESPDLFEPLKKLLRELRDQEKNYELALENPSGEKATARYSFKIGLYLRMLFSCLIDADRTDTADFEKRRAAALRQKGEYTGWQTLTERLEAHLAKFDSSKPINYERRKISEDCKAAAARDKGIYTLTVPTGGGKTLASLRFALNHALYHQDIERIFYVIPFTTIIDQNADVVRKILESPDLESPDEEGRVVLECHSNLTAERETWRGKILSENWDAPIIFTTNVQFLETLFAGGTRSARRTHQLARSVIIFDEIQTLPIRTVHMFCNALNFLVGQCGSTAVLCTATQPLLGGVDRQLGALNFTPSHEILSRGLTEVFNQFKRVEIIDKRRNGGFSYDEAADMALEEQKLSGSVLVVANTTKTVREVYRRVKEKFVRTVHLSANMCPAHRKKALAEIRERLDASLPVICVSTQVIEAGIDIDFSAGIRLLAGLDSIAQASGRVNRHALRLNGRVSLLNFPDEEENLTSLPDICKGREVAQRVLDELSAKSNLVGSDVLDPRTIAHYFEYYFYNRRKEMRYNVKAERNDNLLNMLSSNLMARSEYERMHGKPESLKNRLVQSFKSAADIFRAIDAPTRGIIVAYGEEGEDLITKLCGSFNPQKDIALLRKAQQYTVNVYPHVWKKLDGVIHEVQEGTDIWYLSKEYYSSEFGLSEMLVSKFGLAEA